VIGYPWLDRDHEALLAAASRRGLRSELWRPDQLELEVIGSEVLVTVEGRLAQAKLILPRGVNRVFPFVSKCLEVLKEAGSTIVNSIAASQVCIDKLLTSVDLARCGVATMPTTSSLLADRTPLFEGRVVVKPAFGSGGKDVHCFDDPHALREAYAPPPLRDSSVPLYQHFLVQECATGVGTDYRVVVADGVAVAATTRRAAPGSFVTNGAAATVVPGVPEGASELGERAAQALDLDFAGVDIIHHGDSFVVLEVNCWPGLSYTGAICGVDLADSLIEVAERARSRRMTVGSGTGSTRG
jgi:RimK family alpha-L-glutamate ligase